MAVASSRSRPSSSRGRRSPWFDLQGAWAHAAAFGALEEQTLEEAWMLTEAALNAADDEAG
jgi:hypothetical protein